MKTKLILPLFILLGVVGCGGNNSTSNTSTTSQSQSSQKTSSSLDKVSSSNSEKVSSSSSIIDPSVIVDVPEEDKITPKPSDNFDFDDYNIEQLYQHHLVLFSCLLVDKYHIFHQMLFSKS